MNADMWDDDDEEEWEVVSSLTDRPAAHDQPGDFER